MIGLIFILTGLLVAFFGIGIAMLCAFVIARALYRYIRGREVFPEVRVAKAAKKAKKLDDWRAYQETKRKAAEWDVLQTSQSVDTFEEDE